MPEFVTTAVQVCEVPLLIKFLDFRHKVNKLLCALCYKILANPKPRCKVNKNYVACITQNPTPNPGQQPFNQQQLEECDFSPEDIEYIFRLDSTTGAVTHKVRFIR